MWHFQFEIKKLLPKIKMVGINRSKHGLRNAQLKLNQTYYNII